MAYQLAQASGYLIILALPGLLWVGSSFGLDYLAFVALFVVLPLLRVITGDVPSRIVYWNETVAQLLHALPLVYAALFVIAVSMIAAKLSIDAALAQPRLIWTFLSLWATTLTASCVAHELIHRSGSTSRRIGCWITGVAGYPFLAGEHVMHHVKSNGAGRSDWPQIDESIYSFWIRQIPHVIKEAFARDRVQSLKLGRSRWFGPLAESVAATLTTALLFGYLGGFTGLIVYSALVVLMLVSMQWTVYLQHWGLNESPSLERQSVFGWEDTCQAQAWITLGLSIHDSHHQNASTAFYRLSPNLHAPRPPAGYVVLMLASLFPPLWRRLMLPALRHWETHPQSPIVIGRRLVCLNLASLNPEQLGSVDATLQPKPASPIVPTRR